jgi:hypothetical protein
MEKPAFKEYLENRYNDQLEYYSAAASKNQKRYKQFQWLVIVLSAATPILAALDGLRIADYVIQLKIPVVVISAAVAILTTGLKTFNYMELWVSYRSTHEELKPELHYYNLRVGPYGAPRVNREQLFVARVEAILDKEHKSWPPARKLDENNGEEATEQAPPDADNPEPGATEPTPSI